MRSLCDTSLGKLKYWNRACALFFLLAATAIASPAQTYTTLHTFDVTDGDSPQAALTQATDGDLYGTTEFGGTGSACPVSGSCGTVFKITLSGTLTTLYNFCSESDCLDGARVEGGLVQATNGDFYGTTSEYGQGYPGYGTIFRITPGGTLTTLHSFCAQSWPCPDGAFPQAGLIQATDGNFYGTTYAGGANGGGTVFKITPSGPLTTIYSFCSQTGCADGDYPRAALVQATDGNLYGTTEAGGAYTGDGTVFKMTPSGTLTTLHRFCARRGCVGGYSPFAGLIQAADGNFYGTTFLGGANNNGAVFKITPSGTLTTLHRFDGTDGTNPSAGLVQATDGNFYGTTSYGEGTVFQITPSGTLTTLYSFFDGADPWAGLTQDTNGSFYGTTSSGGGAGPGIGNGTVFGLSTGLGPFVTFAQGLAKVGKWVRILGQGFTGTTSVSFNGTPAAAFTVKRDTYIAATVPAGATTGPVTVTTSSGTLTSNVLFRVRPQILSFTPSSGPVGTQVTIKGVSLTQTTDVEFCGVPASFTVDSDSQLSLTVPAGAQGKVDEIAVTTAGGKVWSAETFTVTP